MLTEKDYCDYDTCVALKELGFREKCSTYYDTEDNVGLLYNTQWACDNTPYQFTDCLESHNAYEGNSYVDAPTLWEAQKWLRVEKKIEVNATYDNVVELHWHWYMKSLTNRNQTTSIINYDSYEQALLAGIKVAVKILKENETIHE